MGSSGFARSSRAASALAALAASSWAACTVMDGYGLDGPSSAPSADAAGSDAATQDAVADVSSTDSGDAAPATVPFLIGAYTLSVANTVQNFGRPVDFGEAYQGDYDQASFDSYLSFATDGGKLAYAMYPYWSDASLDVAGQGAGYTQDYEKGCDTVAPYADRILVVRVASAFNRGDKPWTPPDASPATVNAYTHALQNLIGVIRRKLSVGARTPKIDWNTSLWHMDPTPFYPGDSYVDIISADFFVQQHYFGTEDAAARWQHVLKGDRPLAVAGGNAWGLEALASFAGLHGKPIAFPSWGTDYDDGALIAQMAAWMRTQNVVYHGYWDADEFSLSLDAGQTNRRAFQATWGSTRYLGTYWQ